MDITAALAGGLSKREASLVGFSLTARVKYRGGSFPSALPGVSRTPLDDQKNRTPSLVYKNHMFT